ncbi:phytanoyl-dioxygenase family protein [Grosmannia clavigera kw1407]|uniref:Phytanoyl-dioxygenase family protein n=1 Tax=Grosmannia clavigera (strain kw1407 / UAMH 11150) TaxID=655863 RepID=F0XQV9_GROCL|nr:phytanoyl-dioxygenase family protein [Grosmannia clavigera kw1407]EFW99910.1 phytanoyl-dioxygenase family protein [Grosmannia clavigera kw1407]
MPLLRLLSTVPVVIKPSSKEIRSNTLNERSLETAIRQVHLDGLVVVEDVVPHEHIDILNKKMIADARQLQARGEDGPFNYNLGNIQQVAPPVAEYFYPDFGPRPKWTFCSANTAMPPVSNTAPPQRQPVHTDADFAHPAHPFALVVNVPLVCMTPRNGSTEIWLGTHNTAESPHRRASTASEPPVINKGSIVMCDLRLWHAGMLNWTDEVRVMLACIHFASWYRNPMQLEFCEDIKPILEAMDRKGMLELQTPVRWVSVDYALNTYLNRAFGNAYNFDQTP